MLNAVIIVALALSGLNWVVFVAVTVIVDLPVLERMRSQKAEDRSITPHSSTDVGTVIGEAGTLAGSFRRAGPASTAAAMSMACLAIAAICAGVQRFRSTVAQSDCSFIEEMRTRYKTTAKFGQPFEDWHMPIMPSNAPWTFIVFTIISGFGIILFLGYVVFTLLAGPG